MVPGAAESGQEPPKSVQERPRNDPRTAKSDPRAAHERPGAAQEGSGRGSKNRLKKSSISSHAGNGYGHAMVCSFGGLGPLK